MVIDPATLLSLSLFPHAHDVSFSFEWLSEFRKKKNFYVSGLKFVIYMPIDLPFTFFRVEGFLHQLPSSLTITNLLSDSFEIRRRQTSRDEGIG